MDLETLGEPDMKKYLLAPSANWYRANLHCHTTLSDGRLTPQEVKELYQWRGYSVVAYSDHEKFIPHHDLSDKDFLALSSVEFNVNLGRASRFPLPPGIKPDWRHERRYHFNVFATSRDATEAPERHVIWEAQKRFSGESPEALAEQLQTTYSKVNEWIAQCHEAEFLVQFNHPYWSLNVQEDWRALDGLWALEILNYATQRETASDYCPMVYDDLLRHKGPGVFCTMDDDNHNPACWPTEEHSCGGSTFFAADELSYEAIAASMVKGDFFCASGLNPPRFHSIWVEDGKVHAEFSPVDVAVFTGFGLCFHQVRGAGITSAEFQLPANEPHFRLTLIDRQGNFANSHAYVNDSFVPSV